MDDLLVDSQVGRHLFDQVIKGFLQGKTRIMTNYIFNQYLYKIL